LIEVLPLNLITPDGNLILGMDHLAGELLEGLDARPELIVVLDDVPALVAVLGERNRSRVDGDNRIQGAEFQRRGSRTMFNFGRTWLGATTTLRRRERVSIRLPREGMSAPFP
jgi:hypothetical protein